MYICTQMHHIYNSEIRMLQISNAETEKTYNYKIEGYLVKFVP